MTNTSANVFPIGSLVINFGIICEVIENDPLRGLLVKEVSILTHRGGSKWYANPAMCEAYGESRMAHTDGLVVFG